MLAFFDDKLDVVAAKPAERDGLARDGPAEGEGAGLEVGVMDAEEGAIVPLAFGAAVRAGDGQVD